MKSELNTTIQKLDAMKDELKGELHEIKAAIHAVQAKTTRIELLLEEQSAQSKLILDGITAILGRQDQVEERVTRVEDTVRRLASAQPEAEPA